MNNVLIWVNTYNRPLRLQDLLNDIVEQEDCNISLLIYNDCSDIKHMQNYQNIITKFRNKDLKIEYILKDRNYGKHEYWRLYNMGLEKIKDKYFNMDYYFRLDDDLRLIGKNCIKRIIEIWESIDDDKKISLMPLHDKRVTMNQWSGIQAKEMEFGGQKVMKIGWVDDIYFCTQKFFNVIDKIPTISKKRWAERPDISTGTGQYVTRILVKEFNLYGIHMGDCLITHEFDTDRNPSVMNRKYEI